MSKTGYKRSARVADQIRTEVAEILQRRSKDPRLHTVTVTDVELTDDLRLARVYVTTLQEGQQETEVLAGLARAAGFVRSELGRRLSLRYNPELVFLKDTSGPRGDRILALLDGLQLGPGSETQGDGDMTTGPSPHNS